MIDVKKVDAFFDFSMAAFGQPPMSALFDTRVLLPFSMLTASVRKETGYEVSTDDLVRFVDAGWFRRYEGAGDNGEELGAPLYIPSRIGLFLDLQRDHSYTDVELAEFAAYEDGIVESVLTSDDLAYLDDDLREVIRRVEEDLLDVELDLAREERFREDVGMQRFGLTPTPQEQEELLAKRQQVEASLVRYRSLNWGQLSERHRTHISRLSYRIRTFNDLIRLAMVEQDRGRVSSGFSVHSRLRGEDFGPGHYEPGQIDWPATLYSEWFLEKPERRIRVPGLVIEGMTVTLTTTPSPAEYDRLWNEFDLEEAFRLITKLREHRVCPNCMTTLHGADPRRVYCSETCRHAAKQKRYRQRHPRAAARAQWNYWNSIAEPEVGDVDQSR